MRNRRSWAIAVLAATLAFGPHTGNAVAQAYKTETCIWDTYNNTGADLKRDVPPGPQTCANVFGAEGYKYSYGSWEYDASSSGCTVYIRRFWYAGSPASTGQGVFNPPGAYNPDWQLYEMRVGGNLLLQYYPIRDSLNNSSYNNFGHQVSASAIQYTTYSRRSTATVQHKYFSTFYNSTFFPINRRVGFINHPYNSSICG